MKTQLRKLTVEDQTYAYWHSSGGRFILNISPKEDKNTKISLIFEAGPPEEDRHTFWAFYDIGAQKNNLHTTIHLGKPKHIAEIIHYLQKDQQELWVKGKQHTIDNAWELLKDMGYSDMEPIWIKQW